jgi:NAD(P)-dependent dehydrogenase (short-subunit alcohol dehydrogenase family)
LGKAIALELANQGYAIGLHYHTSARAAQDTADEIRRLGAQVILLPADLRKPEEITDLFQRVAASGLKLKVLINSAAVMRREDIRGMSAGDWDYTMNLNLRAPFLCAQAAVRLMEEEGGVIINIADAGATRMWVGFPAYSVSKAALEALTRLFAKAFAPGVRVNAVAPGLVLPAEGMPEKEWLRLVDRLPVKRTARPEEVAEAVVFLVNNGYITGEVLTVDGGYRLS